MVDDVEPRVLGTTEVRVEERTKDEEEIINIKEIFKKENIKYWFNKRNIVLFLVGILLGVLLVLMGYQWGWTESASEVAQRCKESCLVWKGHFADCA